MRVKIFVVVLAGALASVSGCEAIASLRGLIAVGTELSKHLEEDLKAELTDAKITKVIDVTPKLKKFSETAKVKWEPDPHAPDFSKLASALGGLADYIAFFEGEGTRMTEYYVDLVKINDARALITMRKGYDEAKAKLDTEHKDLEGKLATAQGDEKTNIAQQIKNNEQAKKTLDDAHAQQIKAREDEQKNAGEHGYKLSDAEVGRVEARLPEIDKTFEDAGYKPKETKSS